MRRHRGFTQERVCGGIRVSRRGERLATFGFVQRKERAPGLSTWTCSDLRQIRTRSVPDFAY